MDNAAYYRREYVEETGDDRKYKTLSQLDKPKLVDCLKKVDDALDVNTLFRRLK